eukprot:TRINITY_DN1788_c0_g6_i3.p1 TRINITY_DN1788_c0_g6~~TRINITY_DN1788_c0_g6_i3.p1  ORF type:complete len:195 (-),score=20.56 TRINITY_DN1788_c0_g6_i3:167-751(-)
MGIKNVSISPHSMNVLLFFVELGGVALTGCGIFLFFSYDNRDWHSSWEMPAIWSAALLSLFIVIGLAISSAEKAATCLDIVFFFLIVEILVLVLCVVDVSASYKDLNSDLSYCTTPSSLVTSEMCVNARANNFCGKQIFLECGRASKGVIMLLIGVIYLIFCQVWAIGITWKRKMTVAKEQKNYFPPRSEVLGS